MRIERLNETTKKTLLEDLLKRSPNQYGAYEADVKKILDEVKEKKDEAVFSYTKQFDKSGHRRVEYPGNGSGDRGSI